jgi:hypothetical protein
MRVHLGRIVGSLFGLVYYFRSQQADRRRIVSVTIVAAAAFMAIAFAAPAGAETTGLPAVVTSTTEGSAPADPAATEPVGGGAEEAEVVPSPSPAPQPVATEETAAGTESADSAPVEEVASVAPRRSTSSTLSAPLPDEAATLAPGEAPPPAEGAGVAPIAERAAKLVEETRKAPTETVAPVVEQTAQTVSRQAPLVREALDFVTSSLAEVASPAAEGLLPFAPTPLDFSSPATPDEVRSVPGSSESIGLLVAEQTIAAPEGGLLVKHLSAFGGVESARPAALEQPTGSAKVPPTPLPATTGVRLDPIAGDRPSNSPTDNPVPPFRSPGATSGSGGPSFVPLAALLALLALVAPASFRRRMGVPGFRVPTPFVCALERPG